MRFLFSTRARFGAKQVFFAVLLSCFCALCLCGQNRIRTHMAYVYPAGGQTGTTFRVQVGGIGLQGIKGAVLSNGVGTAKLIGVEVPSARGEAVRLRKEIEKIILTDEPNLDVKMLMERVVAYMDAHPEYKDRRKEIDESYMVRQISNDALAEVATFEVTLAPDAVPGVYAFTIFGLDGLINPLPFRVDTLAEYTTPSFREVLTESGAELRKSHTIATNPVDTTRVFRPEDANHFDVTLPVIVNGQITVAKPDAFTFAAKKGQRIVVAVWARALIPYISDAVPGWFQPIVSVRDAKGEEVAYCDDFYHEVDPLLMFEAPADGTYTVEIRDAVSRGREDFVYRMLIGEVPFVTAVYPLGAQAEAPTALTLSGWNLPQGTVSFVGSDIPRQRVDVRAQGLFQRDLSVQVSPLGAVDIARLPLDKATGAHPVKLPALIDGKIEKPGEKVFLTFDGKKGQRLSAEVTARRLGSPFDGFLLLKGPDGKTVASSDDEYDADEGLITQHADPRFICTLPADGAYRLELTDTQNRGGDLFAYRLQLGAPQDDFSLRITPSNVNVPPGRTAALRVHVTRKGDFKGPVALRVRNAPKGTGFSGISIPEGADEATFTMTIPAASSVSTFPIQVQGVVETPTGRIVRTAVPCESMMQAFYIWHLVPYRDLDMNIIPARGVNTMGIKALQRVGVYPAQPVAPITIPRTGAFSIDLGYATLPPPEQGRTYCDIVSGPPGLTVEKTRIENGRCVVDMAANEREMAKAVAGNLVFSLNIETVLKSDRNRIIHRQIDVLPSIPYTLTNGPVGSQALASKPVAEPPAPRAKPMPPAGERRDGAKAPEGARKKTT